MEPENQRRRDSGELYTILEMGGPELREMNLFGREMDAVHEQMIPRTVGPEAGDRLSGNE